MFADYFISRIQIKLIRHFNNKSYQVVIAGGGAAGTSLANALCKKIPPSNIAVIEPSETHYYQPLWTLVGAGIRKLKSSRRPTASVLSTKVNWLKTSVKSFDPKSNSLTTGDGRKIQYDHLIVALGIQVHYDRIKGLPEAMLTPGVCSIYSPRYVESTLKAIREFKGGDAVFTYPDSPVKCAGAPQKIMYLAEDYFRKNHVTSYTVTYSTSLPVIFVAPKYARVLEDIIKRRSIKVNYRTNLVAVDPDRKEAAFQCLDHPDETLVLKDALKSSGRDLVDDQGYLTVDKHTLQHTNYPNVFGIGDCTNLPTSKTAAAVASQLGILKKNLRSYMEGKKLNTQYNGYTSCPLVTGYGRCVLAEFDYNKEPCETMFLDQGKERRVSYFIKKKVLPFLYWNLMLKLELTEGQYGISTSRKFKRG